jgi:hypothetical protein
MFKLVGSHWLCRIARVRRNEVDHAVSFNMGYSFLGRQVGFLVLNEKSKEC